MSSIDRLDKKRFRSFRDGLDINSPKDYPSIVKEMRSVINNASQEFTDEAIMKQSNYVYLISSSQDIQLVYSELKTDFSEDISSDKLEQFLQKIKYR
jgi:hypothetical protein